MSTPAASDGLALLRAVAEAARTSEGRRLMSELAAGVRRAFDDDECDGTDPVAAEAARLLAPSKRQLSRRRNRGRK